ncbi:MAG TPA: ABC transporter ATP-binding protein [Acidimicrobiales bacterium]|nr:ABC transporter ATP-binding protein [Acidimicrobiales bacterium]
MTKPPGWIRRLAPFVLAHRRDAVASFAAAVGGMVVAGLTPLVRKVVVDDVLLAQRRPLAPWLVLMLAFAVAKFGAAFVRRYRGGRVALDVQHDLRTAIYDRLQRLDFARHDEMQTGQLVSRANSDVGLVFGLLSFLPLMTGNVVMLVVAVIVMAFLSPLLTVVVLLVIPLVLAAAMKLRTSVFPASWDAQQRAAEVAGVVDEAVAGVRVVKGFGQEARELDRLVGQSEKLYASRVRLVRIQGRFSAALLTLPQLGHVAILALGGWLALRGRISIGTFLAFSSYLVQLMAPMRMFAVLLAVAQQARAGAERIFELLDSNPVVRERPDASVLPGLQGDVVFDGVTFGYLRSEPVLRGFSLRVAPGETVALVGASGSGKSTVSLLLPRFYDVQDGAVRVDGIDVRDVSFESLRRQIGVVFEESFLFSDTVRANIAYGRPDATDAEVRAAAVAAEADAFIEALPDGYDTVVGERGLTLSGGQRQRVALARALLTDPRILVLDDATSSVDSRVEEEIHDTLRRLMQGRTTLLVAHRRSTLRLADRIVVVDGGQVADEGTHEELLERSALYRTLLSGPGDDCEAEPPVVTADAWRKRGEAPVARAEVQPAGMGFMHGGPGGGMGNLSPTPDLLARLDGLPPADDQPHIDVVAEAGHDPRFRLRRFVRPYLGALLLGLSLVVVDTLATVAGPALVRVALDHGVVAQNESVLWWAAVGFLGVALVDWVVIWAMTVQTGRTVERLLFALRIRIFAHLQRLGIDFYDREMAGRVMTRMTTDVEALSTLLQTGLVNAVVSLLGFVAVAVVMVVINPRLSLAVFTVVPPLVLATVLFRRASARAYVQARDRIAVVNANLQESLSGVRVAQAYAREKRNSDEFRGVAEDYRESRMGAQRLVSLYFPFVDFLSEVAGAVVLGVGSYLITRDAVTAGAVVAFVLYIDNLFAPVQNLSQVFDTYQQAQASMEKIDELMATPTSTPVPASPVVLPSLRGEVRFDDVWFRYPTAVDDALRGVDLVVRPGETVALVGETGAGKSTLVKLVARFYDPSRGQVLVDGVALTDVDLGAYRQQLGYVPQEAFLFSGTIRDNIAYGRPDASDAEVEAAARAVGAHDFIAGLSGGYLEPVTERGRSLSSGQRQLIALARARLVDPRILLLDEATSNLDLATEARVQRAMQVVAEGRTTLLIAHRLQTAMTADRIVVVDDGRVVEDGSHDDLLARGGSYAELWRAFAA